MHEQLSLALDEYLDLQAALDDLERRKAALRKTIAAGLHASGARSLNHPNARVSLQRYNSMRVPKLLPVLPVLAREGWLEAALQARPRSLYKLAFRAPDAMRELLAHASLESKESLFVVRK